MMLRAFFLLLAIVLASPALAEGRVLNVQTIKSKSGIEAWLVEDKTVPVISVSFSFDGGLAYDPDDKPGVGRLVSILLDEGAGEMKSQEFQKKLLDNAIHLDFTAGRDAFYGELKTLKKNQDTAFGLLNLALNRPRFDADAITRMKNANISQIKNDVGEPGWLAARTFNGMMFEGHYYSRPGFGDLESMETIRRQDLINFVHAQFARNVLKVAIAGDISRAEAEEALDKIFAGLPSDAASAPAGDVTIAHAGKTILLPLDTPQTTIIAGETGIPHTDRDWHAALVLNYILGGGNFDARLMKEIREKRGLTYGVYTSLNSMKHGAIVQASLSVSNEKAAEALKILRQEWALMAEKGPTAQEIAGAKSYLTGSLLLELTSTGAISDALNDLQRDGEEPDYINRRNSLISAVTIEDVKRVAQRILKTDQLTTILVGQPQGIDNIDILLDKPPGMRGMEKQ